MRKKMITGFMVLAFACWSLLLMSSCATQEAQVSDVMEPATPEEAEKVMEAEEAEMEEAATDAAEEARRQARLKELEASQRLADEVRKFESQHIYFDFDKSHLKPEAKDVLRKKAD